MNENQIMALSSWRNLLKVLNDLSEQELKQCIIHESLTNKRLDMTKRMYKRFASLRKSRELFELSICVTASLQEK